MSVKNGKKILTPADKREIRKARERIAAGKGIPLGEFLLMALAHDARKHAKAKR